MYFKICKRKGFKKRFYLFRIVYKQKSQSLIICSVSTMMIKEKVTQHQKKNNKAHALNQEMKMENKKCNLSFRQDTWQQFFFLHISYYTLFHETVGNVKHSYINIARGGKKELILINNNFFLFIN